VRPDVPPPNWIAMLRSLAVLALLLPGAAHAADLAVTDAFSRATPGAGPGAAYLTIHGGDTSDRLLGVSSTAAQAVEMHTMSMQGDVMRMREVHAIEIPAHATVKLAPGADHLMLVGLQAPLKAGDSVNLTLRFEHAGERTVAVPVGAVGANGPLAPMPMSGAPGKAPAPPAR
jgi:copper(I)-binding protein